MNLRSLEYLVALAEHLHFGRAADACFVSQPTLSAQIRKLEQELGVELVERSPSGVMITPAGAQIVERAQEALHEVESIRQIARLSNDPEAGSIRLGVFPTLAPYLLPHVLPLARERFPRLELLLVEEKSDVLLRQLRDGRLDVAVLAVPVGHPLAAAGDVAVAALAGESLLLLDEGHCLRDQALSVCQLVGADERAGFRATSLETLRQMVASGTGVTLLPRLAVSQPVPPSPDVALIELDAPSPSRRIAMYWRSSSPYADFLPRLASVFRTLSDDVVHPIPAPTRNLPGASRSA